MKINLYFHNYIIVAGICLTLFMNKVQADTLGTSKNHVSFPVYNVKDYGAVGDSITLNSAAIQRTIDAAAKAGGGTVYFPVGDYLTGTIKLADNITLYVDNGATIWGSNNLEHYYKEKAHLIWAENAKNIVITGHGKIDGNGPCFWDNVRLEKWYRGEIPWERPLHMITFYNCDNIILQDIDIFNGGFWNVSMNGCNRITVRAITMRNGVYEDDGPNTDGINMWNCNKIQISDCDIIAGDDCLVVLGDSRDVTITNCKLQSSETCLMISGVRNLTFSNSTIHDSGCGIGFRVWSGIVVEGVVIDNIVMDVSDKFKGGGTGFYIWSFPLYVESNDEIPKDKPLPPAGTMKNITFSNSVVSANGLVCVNGEENGFVDGLTINNVKFHMYGNKISYVNENPPYPFPIYGHHASPYSLFFRHVKNLKLNNVELEWNTPEKEEWGSALRCWGVDNLDIDGFNGRQSANSDKPAISLKNVKEAFIHNCYAPEGTGTFLELKENIGKITLMGNQLSNAQKVYSTSPEIGNKVVYEFGNRNTGE